MRRTMCRGGPEGWTLFEVLGVVTLLGIVASVVLYRYSHADRQAVPRAACEARRAEIDTQVGLWKRSQGAWPAADLSDIGASTQYFPLGLPTCPCTGAPYQLDPQTHYVIPHQH